MHRGTIVKALHHIRRAHAQTMGRVNVHQILKGPDFNKAAWRVGWCLTQGGRDKTVAILQTIFSNTFSK